VGEERTGREPTTTLESEKKSADSNWENKEAPTNGYAQLSVIQLGGEGGWVAGKRPSRPMGVNEGQSYKE